MIFFSCDSYNGIIDSKGSSLLNAQHLISCFPFDWKLICIGQQGIARKLDIIIWKMVTNKEKYKPTESHMFLDEKRKLGIVKRIKKKIDKLGVTNQNLGLLT